MTPRVLLLLESRATGGVTTVASMLAANLRQAGWGVAECVVRGGRLRALWTAARRCDVVLASHNFAPAYVGWLLSLLARKPLVVWVHGPIAEVLAQAGTSSLKRRALAWFYRRLTTCVFVSRASKDSFEQFLGGWPASLTGAVVRNAAPVWSGLRAPGQPQGQPVELAYVGRLSPEKQPLVLLDALRLLPAHFRLAVVGDGPLHGQMQHLGADLVAAGRLTFCGHQRMDPDMYGRWRLTLLVSRYEGCPMSLLESLACGVPCVALPIAATLEILADRAPCLLAREHSPEALATAIQDLLHLPPAVVASQMASVLQRHEVDDFSRGWQQVLRAAAWTC